MLPKTTDLRGFFYYRKFITINKSTIYCTTNMVLYKQLIFYLQKQVYIISRNIQKTAKYINIIDNSLNYMVINAIINSKITMIIHKNKIRQRKQYDYHHVYQTTEFKDNKKDGNKKDLPKQV